MRIKPFTHRAKNWGGIYNLIFLDERGRLIEVGDVIDYKVKNDCIEYTRDDMIPRVTSNRLIAAVEVERL